MKRLIIVLGCVAVALLSYSRYNSHRQLIASENFPAQEIQATAMSFPAETPSSSFRVTKATLRAFPAEYTGSCPTEIKFNAKISVTGGKGMVVFQILRSDNLPAPAVTMAFAKSGTRDTTYSWHPKENFLGWHQLKVTEPTELESNRAEIAVQCQ